MPPSSSGAQTTAFFMFRLMRSVGRIAASRMTDIRLHCVAVKEVRASGYAITR